VQASGPRTTEDARAAMRYLIEQRHFSPADIYIAGWSVGSGVAKQLAVESPHSAGLILLSPISSTYDVANQDLIYSTVLCDRVNGSTTPTISKTRTKSQAYTSPFL
jgi:alpha/beta superfamily hydrolase